MKFSNQCWKYMGVFQVIAVIGAKKIGGHDRDEFGSILTVI